MAKIVSNANLKTSTVLAKKLSLNAWLDSGCTSPDRYIIVLKIKTKIGKDGKPVKMESFNQPFPFEV